MAETAAASSGRVDASQPQPFQAPPAMDESEAGEEGEKPATEPSAEPEAPEPALGSEEPQKEPAEPAADTGPTETERRLRERVAELEAENARLQARLSKTTAEAHTQTTSGSTTSPGGSVGGAAGGAGDWVGGAGDVAAAVASAAAEAEFAAALPGFARQPDTGLWYNSETGFYLDTSTHLYYHAPTQRYFFYDQDGVFRDYEEAEEARSRAKYHGFDSRAHRRAARALGVAAEGAAAKDPRLPPTAATVLPQALEALVDALDSIAPPAPKAAAANQPDDDIEEGEIQVVKEEIDLTGVSSESEADSGESETEAEAPCLRLMAQPSCALSVVTIGGGTLGRAWEGSKVDVPVQGEAVSKLHGRFSWTSKRGKAFFVYENVGRNGSLLNGDVVQGPARLCHGDRLEVGGDGFLSVCIHQGNNTCRACEPGEALAEQRRKEAMAASPPRQAPRPSREHQRREEMRRIKADFGLGRREEAGQSRPQHGYHDRARKRRHQVGSTHPSHPKAAAGAPMGVVAEEKEAGPPPASVHVPIGEANRGHQLLSKMGWEAGKGLGREGKGIAEPVRTNAQLSKAGLGLRAEQQEMASLTPAERRRREHVAMMQERFGASNDSAPVVFVEDELV